MTMPQSTTPANPSLGRDVLRAALYYLGNRWALLGLGSLAVIAGLSFGGWGWLVAAGLAPVILSTLPCLVMCAFGVCMMGRSNKSKSTAPRDETDAAIPLSVADVAKRDQLPIHDSSCCHEETAGTRSPQIELVQSHDKRSDHHA